MITAHSLKQIYSFITAFYLLLTMALQSIKNTEASFSLLSQDNSSGNFVKIELRIPVRIDLRKTMTQRRWNVYGLICSKSDIRLRLRYRSKVMINKMLQQ